LRIAREGPPPGPLRGREILVAAAHGETIVLAHRGHADDGVGIGLRQIEIARHAADDGELLPVLLAEQRDIRPHLVEQLAHHRRHAIEMPGRAAPHSTASSPETETLVA
jgi:hypothetical protein